MSDVRCPRCGGTCPPDAVFCGAFGSPLPAHQPNASAESPAAIEVQPPAAIQAPPPNPYQPQPNAASPPPGAYEPPPGSYPPPPGAYAPPPSGYAPPPGGNPPPPGAYPPLVPGAKVVGDLTKWAIGLGIASFFCCGPFSAIPGIFLAKKDMYEIAAGRAPNRDEGWAKGAFYLNIVALCLTTFGICVSWGFWGCAGMRRF